MRIKSMIVPGEHIIEHKKLSDGSEIALIDSEITYQMYWRYKKDDIYIDYPSDKVSDIWEFERYLIAEQIIK